MQPCTRRSAARYQHSFHLSQLCARIHIWEEIGRGGALTVFSCHPFRSLFSLVDLSLPPPRLLSDMLHQLSTTRTTHARARRGTCSSVVLGDANADCAFDLLDIVFTQNYIAQVITRLIALFMSLLTGRNWDLYLLHRLQCLVAVLTASNVPRPCPTPSTEWDCTLQSSLPPWMLTKMA